MRAGASPLINVRKFLPADREPVIRIIQATGVFNPAEIDVAIELMDTVIEGPATQEYELFTAAGEDGEILGYYCLGPTPLTEGTFDLYWIAVKPSAQHRGIGNRLLAHAEDLAVARGGRLMVAETSSMPQYEPTRKFYLRNDYDELARIKDCYAPGDDLITYGKYFSLSEN